MSSTENTANGPLAAQSDREKGVATLNANGIQNDDRSSGDTPHDSRYDHIIGWGIDIDRENDPTYPIKHRTNEEHAGNTWERPTQQQESVEVLSSNERNNLPAVFGTTLPPSGVSGVLRRFAFRYSESDYLHWLPLMLADRINVVEGRIKDLAHGHVPNIVAERGLRAEWKYNKKKCIAKAATTAVIASAAVALIVMRKKRKKNVGGILQVAAGILQKMPKVS